MPRIPFYQDLATPAVSPAIEYIWDYVPGHHFRQDNAVNPDPFPSPSPDNREGQTRTTESCTPSLGDTAAVTGRSIPVSIGQYRILRLIGEGGMGTVCEAE
jgi:hypothetical protein